MKATLMYHSIDDSPSPISVPTAAFEAHLAWLASGRVRALSLDALIHHPDSGEDAVAVTFDDGLENIRTPVERLRAYGVPVTVFVVTGEVGRTNAWGGVEHPSVPTLPLMSWADLEHLASIGTTIAAHTRSHRPLSQLSANALNDELEGCREDLASRLGMQSGHLAYPFGDVDARVAANAGGHYRFAHTTECVPLQARNHPMRLPRIDMYYFRVDREVSRAGGTHGSRQGWPGTARAASYVTGSAAVRSRMRRGAGRGNGVRGR